MVAYSRRTKVVARYRRWIAAATVAAGLLATTYLLVAVPFVTHSYVFTIRSPYPQGSSIQVSLLPTSASVHLDLRGALAAEYWVRGPGAMSGSVVVSMFSSASYSFWASGGVYTIGAMGAVYTCGVPCAESQPQVYVNVTTGFV